ncbi:flagellar motor switch phosphatase FliY [Aeribacillus sp. FSL K6-2848]|uniref:flagellar motor switch phosphatase FliY n=1 Tax=unclassified Aeribacillus TaxID=2640495 RepID=UPI00287217CB|nr:flagellar motor switch phosphatase FliY [Aeribacillus pallidus]
MTDNMLSQEEIDSLLKGGNQESTETDNLLNDIEKDTIGEIGNISFGSSATALSSLLNQKVEITTPSVSIINKQELAKEFPHPYVAIEVVFTEGLSGSNLLVIKQSDAAVIADLMIGGDGSNPDELGEIQLSAVQEAMNQMMGSASTSMSTVLNKKIDISPPRLELLNVKEGEGTDAIPDDELLVKVSFRLTVGNLIDSNIMQLLPLDFAKQLVVELMNKAGKEASNNVQTEPEEVRENQQLHIEKSEKEKAQPVEVKPVEFATFDEQTNQSVDTHNLELLLDIPLNVTVELGRTKRSIKQILELSKGSIIELDKLAGEPVDIFINSKKVAKGEVVVIDENFGVRVTDIMSQADRIMNLK